MVETKLTSKQCYLTGKCPKYQKGDCNIEEDAYCMRLHKIDSLYNLALLPQNQKTPIQFRLTTGEGDKRDRAEGYPIIKNFALNINSHVKNGDSLFIHSDNYGNGKTEWALTILRNYIGSIWHTSDLTCKALYIQVPKFLLALKEDISTPNEYARYIKSNALKADLVVFDEVGTKGLTEFEHEQLLSIINSRIDMGKSNIYTSNLNAEKLALSVGPRLASRILGLSTEVELFGEDKRKYNVRGNTNNGSI